MSVAVSVDSSSNCAAVEFLGHAHGVWWLLQFRRLQPASTLCPQGRFHSMSLTYATECAHNSCDCTWNNLVSCQLAHKTCHQRKTCKSACKSAHMTYRIVPRVPIIICFPDSANHRSSLGQSDISAAAAAVLHSHREGHLQAAVGTSARNHILTSIARSDGPGANRVLLFNGPRCVWFVWLVMAFSAEQVGSPLQDISKIGAQIHLIGC